MKRLMPPDMRDELLRRIPLQRFGRSAEIGDAAIFLSSEAASWITGAVISIDGGALAWRAL